MADPDPKDPEAPSEGAAIAADAPAQVPNVPGSPAGPTASPVPTVALGSTPGVPSPATASGFVVPHQYPSKAEGLPPIPPTPTHHVVPTAAPTPAASPAAALAEDNAHREDVVAQGNALREAAVAAARKTQGG
jgi:hypothetical protein